MSAHTPGPWRIDPAYSGPYGVVGRGGRFVASAGGVDPYTDEDEANARLIAAAPDLLALATVVAESIARDARLHSRFVPGRDRTWGEIEPLLRAAIAKATGEPAS